MTVTGVVVFPYPLVLTRETCRCKARIKVRREIGRDLSTYSTTDSPDLRPHGDRDALSNATVRD